MNDELARIAAIMRRATTMSEHMQVAMLEQSCPDCAGSPPQGWIVSGPILTASNIANDFCFIENDKASLNDMQRRLAGASHDLV